MSNAEKLGQDRLNLLVVEDNEYMLDVLANGIWRMGFTRLLKCKAGKDAVEHLKRVAHSVGQAVEPIDIVISDLVMSPVGGIHLLRWLRDDPQSPNRFMPFVMVSGAADKPNVVECRDHGVHDFMAKPFSVENIYRVLQRLIDAPRQFVTTQTYFGPDRRRANKDIPGERRRPDESHATIVYSKDKIEKPKSASDVWLFKLPNHLKEKMGSNAMRAPFALPKEVLAFAEEQLQREAEGFVGWCKNYLDSLSAHVAAAKETSADRNPVLADINLIAHELRGQGGTFGYPLITIFGKSLYDTTAPPCRNDDAFLEIVKAHIDAMRAVLRDRIAGEGGQVGLMLFKTLRQAIAKHSANEA